MRRDLREGADFDELPTVGFGRICGGHDRFLREWYVTVRIGQRRLFVASGLYDLHRRSLRYWFKSETVRA